MLAEEMLAFQGMDDKFKQARKSFTMNWMAEVVSDRIMGQMIGNAMSQNVLERLLPLGRWCWSACCHPFGLKRHTSWTALKLERPLLPRCRLLPAAGLVPTGKKLTDRYAGCPKAQHVVTWLVASCDRGLAILSLTVVAGSLLTRPRQPGPP